MANYPVGLLKVGRPRALSDEKVEEYVEKFRLYIEETDFPKFKEFCMINGLIRSTVKGYKEFSPLREFCKVKYEYAYEVNTRSGEINANWAKFALMQQGWSDRSKIEEKQIVYEAKLDINKMTQEEIDQKINEKLGM